MPLDGVLLELHGSMSVGDLDGPDGLGDAEGHLLAAVRETVGPEVPVLAQLDIHSNVSQQMVAMADGGRHVGARPRVRGRAGAHGA